MKTKETKSKAPKWLLKREGITQRQWKTRKRRELNNAIKAFDIYHLGSAFCPGDKDGYNYNITAKLDELKSLLSVKKWGR